MSLGVYPTYVLRISWASGEGASTETRKRKCEGLGVSGLFILPVLGTSAYGSHQPTLSSSPESSK